MSLEEQQQQQQDVKQAPGLSLITGGAVQFGPHVLPEGVGGQIMVLPAATAEDTD